MKKLLLDLSTETDRDTIKIDGAEYEIRAMDEFGIQDIAGFQAIGKKLQAAGNDPLGKDNGAGLVKSIDEMIDKIVVSLPPDIKAKLTDWHKVKIIQVFADAANPEGQTGEAANQQTGEQLSPDSKTDMEATGTTG
jgi:hypothetical protein